MNIVIIGVSGGIGSALTELISSDVKNTVFALGRTAGDFRNGSIKSIEIDFKSEPSLQDAAQSIIRFGGADAVISTVGLLHSAAVFPEKTLRTLNAEVLAEYFFVNSICTGLALKHFVPVLKKESWAVFASLSARVGSISDNRLGGWYGYRASKAAQNMLIKTASIEVARTHKYASIVGLHPGTVDTSLSEPFTKNRRNLSLFTPEYSALKLWNLIQRLKPEDTGHVFAYDGCKVPC